MYRLSTKTDKKFQAELQAMMDSEIMVTVVNVDSKVRLLELGKLALSGR